MTVGPPRRLRLTADHIDAQVEAVGVDAGGSLGVPPDISRVGWWQGGAQPGSAAGTVVIDGHVDSAAAGRGALFRLSTTPIGATAALAVDGGQVRYIVRARHSYAKDRLPADLFTRTGTPRLVLITCGGSFDRDSRHYQDNVVVYATPS